MILRKGNVNLRLSPEATIGLQNSWSVSGPWHISYSIEIINHPTHRDLCLMEGVSL
jgi:hypothetical protein